SARTGTRWKMCWAIFRGAREMGMCSCFTATRPARSWASCSTCCAPAPSTGPGAASRSSPCSSTRRKSSRCPTFTARHELQAAGFRAGARAYRRSRGAAPGTCLACGLLAVGDGSLDELDEPLEQAAAREVREETGIDATTGRLTRWNVVYTVEVYQQ